MRIIRNKKENAIRTLLGDSQGAVFVEYVALLLLVTISGAAAVLSLGVPLLRLYRYAQMILVLPFP